MGVLTWREVFDPKVPMGSLQDAMRAMRAAGYRYCAWQGGVYALEEGGDAQLDRARRVGAVGEVQ
jgi:hypothetical protein